MSVARKVDAKKAPRAPKAKQALRGSVAQVYKAAILDAAERVFGRRGFTAAKMADIAREAGVAAGTLYNYFESKEAIFQALLDHRGEAILAEARKIAGRHLPPRDALVELTRSIFAFVETHRAMFQLLVELGGMADATLREACGPAADRRKNEHLDIVRGEIARARKAGLIRAGLADQDLTYVLMGGMHGLLHGRFEGAGEVNVSESAELIVQLFFEGAAPRKRR